MKNFILVLIAAFLIVGKASAQPEQNIDNIEALIESIEFDLPVNLDVKCTISHPSAMPFVAKIVIRGNGQPIRSDDPNFPKEFCPPNTNFLGSGNGEGMGNLLGRFTETWRVCAIKGFKLEGNHIFIAENGDELYAHEVSQAGPTIPPPFPNATFDGTFTFTGGTGRFTGATGEATLTSKQLGDAPAPNAAGTTAVVLCGWIKLQSDK